LFLENNISADVTPRSARRSPAQLDHMVRTATRPVLTILGFLAWTTFIAYEVPVPDPFQWAVLGMLGTWFGERALKRVLQMGGKP